MFHVREIWAYLAFITHFDICWEYTERKHLHGANALLEKQEVCQEKYVRNTHYFGLWSFFFHDRHERHLVIFNFSCSFLNTSVVIVILNISLIELQGQILILFFINMLFVCFQWSIFPQVCNDIFVNTQPENYITLSLASFFNNMLEDRKFEHNVTNPEIFRKLERAFSVPKMKWWHCIQWRDTISQTDRGTKERTH